MSRQEQPSRNFSEIERARQALKEDPRYGEILDQALPLLAQGRWYDLWHTLIAVGDMDEVLQGERKAGVLKDKTAEEYSRYRGILIPSIILHDIGWSALDEEKNTRWDAADMRVKHMHVGAELAQGILENVGYDQELIPDITALIAHHDDQYLGVDPKTDLEKIHRDVDACFILTYPSFWKDYDVKGEGAEPLAYFQQQSDKHGQRYTASAQAIMDREAAAREQEARLSQIVSPNMRYEELRKRAVSINSQAVK